MTNKGKELENQAIMITADAESDLETINQTGNLPYELVKDFKLSLKENINQVTALIKDLYSEQLLEGKHVQKFTPIRDNLNELRTKLKMALVKVCSLGPTEADLNRERLAVSTTPQLITPQITLPTLKLKPFDGDPSEWNSFFDQFKAVVLSTSLPNTDKLQHLKMALTGEPLSVISQLKIEDLNLEVALTLLREKYENRRKVIFHLLDKLFSLKPSLSGKYPDYSALIYKIKEIILQLQHVNIFTKDSNEIFLKIILHKLSPSLQRKFLLTLTKEEIPPVDDLFKFVLKETETYTELSESKNFIKEKTFISKNSNRDKYNSNYSPSKDKSKFYNQFKTNYNVSINKNKIIRQCSCKFCDKTHKLYSCIEFKKLSIKQRREFVAKNKICPKCLSLDLSNSHTINSCTYGKCHRCSMPHNRLLHLDNLTTTIGSNADDTVQLCSSDENAQSWHVGSENCAVLLARARVRVRTPSGDNVTIKSFLDAGSELNLIDKQLVEKYGFSCQSKKVSLKGLNNTQLGNSNETVLLTIASTTNPDFAVQTEFSVVDNLKINVPQIKLDAAQFNFIRQVRLADPNCDTPAEIHMLIGASLYSEILNESILRSENSKLTAQSTELGYILFGTAKAASKGAKIK